MQPTPLGPIADALIADLVARAPNPGAAALALERFLAAADAATLARLREEPRRVQPLLVIFSYSQFLAESLIRDPQRADWLDRARRQDRILQPEELAADLAEQAGAARPEDRALALVRWKKRELLRIALRDLDGQATLAETTLELSNVADAALSLAQAWARNELVARFGTPLAAADQKREVAGVVVLALGKLGGEELNYSSDIDLMFLYTAEGETDGHGAAGATSNREFFIRLAQETVRHLATPTAEGTAYRVDLRLRPTGREGEIALPIARALDYYRQEARPWELQMLIKARPAAGQREQGKRLLAALAESIYPPGADGRIIGALRAMRGRLRAQPRHRGAALDVKLDPGGIRDIEFLTQGLQRRFGGGDAWLRAGNTLQALQRLHDKRRLTGRQFQILSSAYVLLRTVEHRLQLRLGQQTHSLPTEPEAQRLLARGLRPALPLGEPAAHDGASDAAWLGGELERAMRQVRELFEALLPPPATAAEGDFRLVAEPAAAEASADARARDLRQRLKSSLTARGRHQLARLLAGLPAREGAAEASAAWPEETLARLATLLNRSDFLVDALALRGHDWQCVVAPLPPPDERQASLWPPAAAADTLASQVLAAGHSLGERMRTLRRAYQARLCRYIAGEVLAPGAIEPALRRLSDWADAAVAAALRVAAAAHEAAPETVAVLALGRLGVRQFDLFSDADLLFVAREEQRMLATRLAATTLEVLASYTQDGIVFPVDARLRPEGTQGELVHTPHGLGEYFGKRADLWEAVSYLKLRPLTGDLALAEHMAADLGDSIAARFGRRPTLRAELRAMRERIEGEERVGRGPFKTGPGGSYDLDFIAATEALGRGSVHPPVGELYPKIVDEVCRALRARLRAADHVLRIVTGKAPRAIAPPASAAPAADDLLAAILRRPLAAGGLAAEVESALARVRAIYDQVLR